MRIARRWMVVGGCAVALAAAGVGTGIALTGDDGEGTVSGPEADRARAAALGFVPGGSAGSVERDSEDGATWEVEVRRPGGGVVDVRLDAGYGLVVIDGDSEAPDDGTP